MINFKSIKVLELINNKATTMYDLLNTCQMKLNDSPFSAFEGHLSIKQSNDKYVQTLYTLKGIYFFYHEKVFEALYPEEWEYNTILFESSILDNLCIQFVVKGKTYTTRSMLKVLRELRKPHYTTKNDAKKAEQILENFLQDFLEVT